jgi:lysophospholipase L1-like esterase
VVNLGVPGASTKRQAQELGAFLQRHDAQLVILLTGRNNANEVERWGDSVVQNGIISRLDSLRSPKFLTALFDRLVKGNTQQRDDYLFKHRQRYADYLIFYLEQIRRLCREKGAKLILLSYYNSTDDIIKDFARSRGIPYFDFTSDFDSLFIRDKRMRYISPDTSHMNHRGYKFFAEQLYNYLFLNQRSVGFTIYPAVQRIDDAVFYSNEQEMQRMIKVQEARIERSRNSQTYAFELIRLGHIYSEIGNDAFAYKYYREGLIAANYIDNNTIVSPIINWYLKKGQRDAALKISEEILQHNPANSIAQTYRAQLFTQQDGVVGDRTIH